MAKGNYKKEFGGSKSGWDKGRKNNKNKNLLITAIVAVGALVLGFLVGNSKK